MNREAINATAVPEPIGPYSHAIHRGSTLYCTEHPPPARTAIGVAALPMHAMVEIDAIVAIPED